jgi:hypothetical protein
MGFATTDRRSPALATIIYFVDATVFVKESVPEIAALIAKAESK